MEGLNLNFIEEHGKKVAAILCVASAIPAVGTVFAMETEPGWHGDKYITEEQEVATGWQEIQGESYYFNENDGTVDPKTTMQAKVATVSDSLSQQVKNAIVDEIEQIVVQETATSLSNETVVPVEDTVIEEVTTDAIETPSETNPSETENVAIIDESVPAEEDSMVDESTSMEEDPTIVVETPSDSNIEQDDMTLDETILPDESETNDSVTSEDSSINVEPPEISTSEDAVSEDMSSTSEPSVPIEEETSNESTLPEITPEGVAPDSSTTSSMDTRIAEAAKSLVGTTDGWWCTQVVQKALELAGVANAYQLWPDQYQGMYGYFTDVPVAGNLIYYNNGGRGVDHIAIYIGNGMAVHGNYNGKTVIAPAYINSAGTPQFIQVIS